MKPFNLERALAGDPVVTRDGQKVAEIAHLPSSGGKKTVVYARNNGYRWVTTQGKSLSIDAESDDDLFMAPKQVTVTRWVNLYDYGLVSDGHLTEEEAIKGRTDNSGRLVPYAATIKITHTFEEQE